MFDDNFSLLKVTNLTLWLCVRIFVGHNMLKVLMGAFYKNKIYTTMQCKVIKHCLHVLKYVNMYKEKRHCQFQP